MISLSPRTAFAMGALASLFMMLIALLYFQQHLQLAPCPLCVFQRVAVIAIGITCLIAAIHNPGRLLSRLYSGLVCLFAVAGGAVSARHSWLQHLPPEEVPECGPGLNYMLESFPITRVFEMVFRGSGECAEVTWSLLGLSIPEWTLLGFVGFFAYAVWFALTARPSSRA